MSETWEALTWWLGPFGRVPPPGRNSRPAVPAARSGTVLHLACAADSNYAPHCAAMLNSALDYADGCAVVVHFLHEPELPVDILGKLEDVVSRKAGKFSPVAVPDNLICDLYANERITRVAWYRSLLPQLLPDLDRVLYLDCDVLVVDSLRELWETELGGNYAAAVRNVFEPALATRHLALGLPAGQPYFNSGVMLMNLALMRRDRCTERILAHARQHASRLIWVDQDSVNLVLGTRCSLLHPRWNCQNSLFYWRRARAMFGIRQVEEATQNPAILHFEGPGLAKPWNPLCKHPYRAHYHFNLAQTPWHAVQVTRIDWGTRVLRLLPMRITPVVLDAVRRLRRRLDRALTHFHAR